MSKRLISCCPSSTSCSHAPKCIVYAPLACSSGRYPEYAEPCTTNISVYAPTINQNEVTIVNSNQTITVVQPQPDSPAPAGYHGRHHHWKSRGGEQERPPKLARFCRSAGMLDSDVVSRMDADEIASESAKCIDYFWRQAIGSFGEMADSCFSLVGGVCRGVSRLFG